MYNSSAAPWTVTCQAPLSTGFSRQEYWSGLPLPSPGDLPDAGIEPGLLHWQEDFYHWATWGALVGLRIYILTQNNGNNIDNNADKGNSIVCPMYRRGGISRIRYQVSQMFNWCLISQDLGLIPGLGRSPEEGKGNPLPYSCLENPVDGGAW